jgi:hypothetical protein
VIGPYAIIFDVTCFALARRLRRLAQKWKRREDQPAVDVLSSLAILSRSASLVVVGALDQQHHKRRDAVISLTRYLSLTNEPYPMTSVRERSRMPSTTRMMPVAAA